MKEQRAPVNAPEILAAVNIDVEGDAALAEAVRSHPKISATSEGLYEYKVCSSSYISSF